MVRVVKEAQERRTEILDTAERLFREKSYDATTMRDLHDDIGIAKGTLYHHFASKEQIMDALVERQVSRAAERARAVADADLDPISCFMQILVAQRAGPDQDGVVEHLEARGNDVMHLRSTAAALRALAPILADVVRRGTATGVFRTDDPDLAVEVVLTAASFLFDHRVFEWSPERAQEKLVGFLGLVEAVLGTRPGVLGDLAAPFDQADRPRETVRNNGDAEDAS